VAVAEESRKRLKCEHRWAGGRFTEWNEMKSGVRVVALAVALFGSVACGGGPSCPGGGLHPPAGSSSDVHPLLTDAGFWLSDAGGPLRVTAAGSPLWPTCHQVDGGGGMGYADGGFDYTFPDGGSADGDGGCHVTEGLIATFADALAGTGLSYQGEVLQGDGTVVEQFGFTAWSQVDPAVQISGQLLVDAGRTGPIELVPEDTGFFCK
jgi:hypothetical protein